jgi:hypothetical protein
MPKDIDVPGVGDVNFVQIAQSIGPWSGNHLDHVGTFLG